VSTEALLLVEDERDVGADGTTHQALDALRVLLRLLLTTINKRHHHKMTQNNNKRRP